MAMIVVMSATFWYLATPLRIDDRISDGGISLDGEAYLRTDTTMTYGDGVTFAIGADLPLVRWLRSNVSGIRVVAEAPGIDYQWTGRVSWLTGLPTPIGWAYHESQQRREFGATIERRKADLFELYTTSDAKAMARVVATYDVAYVVYGTQERRIASPESADALADFACLTIETRGEGADTDLFVAAVDQDCVKALRPFG